MNVLRPMAMKHSLVSSLVDGIPSEMATAVEKKCTFLAVQSGQLELSGKQDAISRQKFQEKLTGILHNLDYMQANTDIWLND
jgi:hypothetical protein